MNPPLAVAPNFPPAGAWPERLLVPDSDAWRAPEEAELAALVREPTTQKELAECACLFVLPAHLRLSFWQMLQRQAEHGDGDFVAFAAEVARFLAFKQLPAPAGAAFELVVQTARGAFDGAGLWGVANLGDEPALIAWPTLRLRLGPGEGCRLPGGAAPDVLPGGDDPGVLLVVRSGSQKQ